jgi:hypothetical protein
MNTKTAHDPMGIALSVSSSIITKQFGITVLVNQHGYTRSQAIDLLDNGKFK